MWGCTGTAQREESKEVNPFLQRAALMGRDWKPHRAAHLSGSPPHRTVGVSWERGKEEDVACPHAGKPSGDQARIAGLGIAGPLPVTTVPNNATTVPQAIITCLYWTHLVLEPSPLPPLTQP